MKLRLSDFLPLRNTTGTQYVLAILFLSAQILIFFNLQNLLGYRSVSLLLLFLITIMPLLGFTKGPIILSSIIAALGWNFFFIPPHFTLHIDISEDIMMLAMFFIIALVNGMLTSKLKKQEVFIKTREEKTNAAYLLLKSLAKAESLDDVSKIAVEQIKTVFGFDAAIIFAGEDGNLNKTAHKASSFQPDGAEWLAANLCFIEKKKYGRTAGEVPDCEGLYYPLIGSRSILGVLGIKNPARLTEDEQTFLNNFISQIINAVEREILNEIAKKTLIISEAEKLYKTLFNSVSHELRTPLTSIIIASSSLEDAAVSSRKDVRLQLSSEIRMAAERLDKLVENLLDITRLETGHLKIKTEWNDIDDLINAVLHRFKKDIKDKGVKINIRSEPMLFKFDFGLLEQSLINIIHNCIIYSQQDPEIAIEVVKDGYCCSITITDNGKGFPQGALDKLFNKFYRVPGTGPGGTGLGLSIARGFIEAHDGSIKACNSPAGGAQFNISLPLNNEDGKKENTGN